MIKMKEMIAKKIAGLMNDTAKRNAIQMFYDKNKDNPEIDKLLKDIRDYIDYHKEDVPKR